MVVKEAWAQDSLLEQVIQALAASDASELNRLLRIAEDIRRRPSEISFDESMMRLLSSLLTETSRNLRLLKRVNARAGGAILGELLPGLPL